MGKSLVVRKERRVRQRGWKKKKVEEKMSEEGFAQGGRIGEKQATAK